MKNLPKIRVIKKSVVGEQARYERSSPVVPEPKSNDVFRNVSDWVKQNQARKRDEDRIAAEAFFGVGKIHQRA